MKKDRNDTAKRSGWKTFLKVVLGIFGVLALAVGTLVAVYYYEDSQPTCWKSGEVTICGQPITLPCSVEEFESALDVRIPDEGVTDFFRMVTVDKGGKTVTFKVYLPNGLSTVNGIVVYEDCVGDPDGIVFPGGVTLESDIAKVRELYSTSPLNIYHSYWSEEIGTNKILSEGYRYVDRSSFQVQVCTSDGVVDEIFYCYIADE